MSNRAKRLGESLNEWNETYHVTGRLSNAFHIAGDATTRIIDELFPFMQDQPIHHQPREDSQNPPSAMEESPVSPTNARSLSPLTEGQDINPSGETKSEVSQSGMNPE